MVKEKNASQGYKQTGVGVIPADWEIKRLGEILDSAKLGGNYPNSELETEHPLIKMGNIDRGTVDTSKMEYVSEGYIPAGKDKLHYGDLLFNTRNTLELVGKVAIWRNELPCAYYNSNLLRLEFKTYCAGSNFFMNYIFNTNYLISQLRGFATGTTSVAAIYSRDLYKVKIPLPPLAEQKAIAKVLSDVDELITSTEKFIAKKQKIKQGTMQLLLTGKKRLPGFTGDWEVKKLRAIVDITMGQSPPSRYYNLEFKGIPLVQGNADIRNRKTIKRFFTTQTTKMCRAGDVIMTVRAPVGEVGKALFDACIGRGVCAIPCVNGYLYYYFISIEKYWAKFSKGSTFDSVNSLDIKELKVNLPEKNQEQKAIAQILSDMDSEIEALEKKLEKYKLIKEGMMDKLLTGKVRLV
jgi:type I restriction enzyme S subunit